MANEIGIELLQFFLILEKQSKTIFSFWLNIQLKWAFEEKKKELIFLSSLTSLLSQYCER